MSLLTPEQMQDGLLRLEADLLDLTTQVNRLTLNQQRTETVLLELKDSHLRLESSFVRLQDTVEKFLRARTDGQN